MARNTKNFIDAYLSYADTQFAPTQFHLWSAISIVAAALERKVWLPWGSFSYYPNLFIFLVAHPGIGKSSAINKAVGLLEEMNDTLSGNIFFVPSQVTQAKFIDLMSQAQSFEIGTKVTYHSSGYYCASEGSDGLQNIFGDFIASITNFYDCPAVARRATMKDGRTELKNVCLNLLAGTTFDFLGKLVTNENIMGGFASRVTYVIFRDKLVRSAKFQGAETPDDLGFRAGLLADLASIHRMKGNFRATPEVAKCYEEWQPQYELSRQSMQSEKMQSIMMRKQDTIFKLCMILSAAESDDRIIREHHWHRAMELLTEADKDLPAMLRESGASRTDSQLGLIQSILGSFGERGVSCDLSTLRINLILKGFAPMQIDSSIAAMVGAKAISRNGDALKLLIDPNSHL